MFMAPSAAPSYQGKQHPATASSNLSTASGRPLGAADIKYENTFNGTISSTGSGSTDGIAPGRPGLQSSRLVYDDSSMGLSKTLMRKMSTLLKELGAPEQPVPTRAVCDMYDQVGGILYPCRK